MKNLLVLIVILFLSCKNKDVSILISGVASKVESTITEHNSDNSNSDFIRTVLYEGTLNGTVKISLYLSEQEHPCGGNLTIINTMYKYDNQEKWLLLNVTTDKEKKKYCMVEDNFSGVLFLEKDGKSFNGNWISPDTKKQFEVQLEEVSLDKETNEQLEETLFDDLLYNKNDC